MVTTRAEWERQKLRALKRKLKREPRGFPPEEKRRDKEPDLPIYAKKADNDG